MDMERLRTGHVVKKQRKLGNRRIPNSTYGGVRGRGDFLVSPSYSISDGGLLSTYVSLVEAALIMC